MRPVSVVMLSAFVLGSPAPAQADMVWMRIDGQKSSGSPALEQEFYAARYQCLSSAAAGVAAPTPSAPDVNIEMSQRLRVGPPDPPLPYALRIKPWKFGLDPSVEMRLAEMRDRREMQNMLFESCMNASGYRLTPRPR